MSKINSEIISKCVKMRALLGTGNQHPIDIFAKLLEREDFTIVKLPLSEHVRGFSHNEKGHKIIVINANDSEPIQNYSCAHELYHLYYNYDENYNLHNIGSNTEKEAESFSANFLVPQEALHLYINNKNISPTKMNEAQLCEMDRYFGVSRKALVIRLQEEGLIDQNVANKYSTNVKRCAKKNGFDVSYYEKNEDSFDTTGEYLTLAYDLYDSGKISKSKYNAYLLDAFRGDIVYNLQKDTNDKN